MALVLRYAARSDVGLIREGNEDSGYAGPSLLLVADGMGGHAAGELASAIAVASVADLDVHPPEASDVLGALADSITDVGDGISDVIADDPDLTGMGTTVTGLYWLGERIAVVHVGDSRAYLLRDDELTQITHDHTYVQTLVDAGRITEEEAAVHPRRSLLMRALDGMNPVEADLSIREARVGDRYMLCTDGLSGLVRADEIAGHLRDGDPTGVVTRLVDLALERGAPDNVTVVVADVVDVVGFGDVSGVGGSDDVTADRSAFAPVVVGAAGEPRVRLRLPGVRFPDDAQVDPDRPDAPAPFVGGPPTAPQPLIDAEIIVPAAETARRNAANALARSQDRRRLVRMWAWIGGAVAFVVLVLVGILIAATSWLGSQWYVGVNDGGTVAVYRGVPQSLFGFPLSSLVSDSQIPATSLSYQYQSMLNDTISAPDEAGTQIILEALAADAAQCAVLDPPAGCPGSVQ
jgi:protein phosphatase